MANEPKPVDGPEADSDLELNIESGLENELEEPTLDNELGEIIPDNDPLETDMGTDPAVTGTDKDIVEAELGVEPDNSASVNEMSDTPSGEEGVTASPSESLGDAFAEVANAFVRLIDVIPPWALMGLGALMAVMIGLLLGRRMGRRKEEPAPVEPSEPKVVHRALPAPESPAFVKYQDFLEQKKVPAKEFDSRVRAFADQYKEMRQNLRDLMPGDKTLDPSVEEIRDSLDQGDFDHALSLLTEIGKRENTDGVEKHRSSQKHLMAAAIAKNVAADLQMARMEYAAAAELYREAVEALPDFQEDMHGEYLNKFGSASYQAGDHDSAIDAFEQSLKILERKLGKNHPDVATALNNLALLYYSRGNYDAAEPLYQRSLAIDEHTLGIDHPGVATDLNNLALLYKKQGNLEAAEPLLKRAMEIKEKQFDPGHPSLVTGLKNYASLLRALGREEEAEVFERKANVLPPKRTVKKSA
jgi:tetratricopeptide (TPR) repeat protein